MPNTLFGYNRKCSFGLLTFDTAKSCPQATYRIINIDNEIIHEFSLRKIQLTHGKAREESMFSNCGHFANVFKLPLYAGGVYGYNCDAGGGLFVPALLK